jgi:uncharacterized protein YbjT (DUF2867 family)
MEISMRILIAGATGSTGQILAHKVKQAGHTPIAMVRDSSDTSVLPEGCDSVKADLTNLDQSVVHGADVVVFAAGAGGGSSKDATDAVDRNGAKALIGAAQSAGIRRFVMLSSIGADAPSNGPDGMQHYLDAKHEADEYLKNADIEYIIVRPVALTDDEETGMMHAAPAVDQSKSVTRGDVASALLLSAISTKHINKTFEMSSGDEPIEQAYARI